MLRFYRIGVVVILLRGTPSTNVFVFLVDWFALSRDIISRLVAGILVVEIVFIVVIAAGIEDFFV